MNTNTLEIGENRPGTLFTGEPPIDRIPASLTRTEKHISVEIPWLENEPIMRWFSSGVQFMDDPGKIKYSYTPPRQMWFSDSHGTVCLLGCSVGPMTHRWGTGGVGTLYFQCAILDASVGVDYSHITQLQSSITGLRQWVGSSSVQEHLQTEHVDGYIMPLIKSNNITLKSPENIRFGTNSCFRSHWSVSRHDDIVQIHDIMYLESSVSTPVPWNDLQQDHHALRDLLRISSWRDHIETISYVSLDQDCCRVETGAAYQKRWCPVITPNTKESALPKNIRYLLEYSDFTNSGFEPWLSLRMKYSRAINPMMSLFQLKGATIEAWVTQCAIGLEALGYLLFVDDGESEKQANKHSFKSRLERIANQFDSRWPFDISQWATTMSDTYNGIKHANRALPNLLTSLNAWRESVQVFRGWIALHLGLDYDTLLNRLQWDHMSNRYLEA